MRVLSDNLTRQLLHEKIKKAEVVHFIFNDKFAAETGDTTRKGWGSDKHLVFCRRLYYTPSIKWPTGSHIVEIENCEHIDPLDLEGKKLVFHSLFDRVMVEFLWTNKQLLKNSHWLIWGGDMYESKDDAISLFVKRNFKKYFILAPQEKEVFIRRFGEVSGSFQVLTFWSYWNRPDIQTVEKKFLLIQINHSCSIENIEMLDILSRFKDENIKIRCILSYGNRIECKHEIIKKGIEIFGDKFEFFDTLMQEEEYYKKLAEVDILVMNQNRQQGLSNIYMALLFGIKVFIKKEISTYPMIREKFNIYDTNAISTLDFNQFIEYPFKEQTKKESLRYIEECNNTLVSRWEEALA
jgi:hypothetical protein